MRLLARKIRHMGVLDWALIVLAVTVLTATSVLVHFHFFHAESAAPWAGISYQEPALVVDRGDATPTSVFRPELPTPSFDLSGTTLIPVRLTRYIDCAAYTCPSGTIPVSIDVSWLSVNTDGTTTGSFSVLEDLQTAYVEGEDYDRNRLTPVVNDLAPFEVPAEVMMEIVRGDSPVSAWRIEGTTTPLVPGGLPSAWVTEIFHIYAPQEAT